jgi:hypothetical protein
MKLRQLLKKRKEAAKVEKKQKRILLLDGALKKLIELKIAIVDDGKIKYSHDFENTALAIKESPPSKLHQAKLANEAGRKLIPQILALAVTKPSRRDIENMIVAYVCFKTHIEQQPIEVDKKLVPDLAYAVWYLNDNEPTMEEIETWILPS